MQPVCIHLQRQEDSVRSSVDRITGCCEPPDMGAGNKFWSSTRAGSTGPLQQPQGLHTTLDIEV